ncbi:hypothetical protein MTO96_019404 [Rhipicephalus appendiculatus]
MRQTRSGRLGAAADPTVRRPTGTCSDRVRRRGGAGVQTPGRQLGPTRTPAPEKNIRGRQVQALVRGHGAVKERNR